MLWRKPLSYVAAAVALVQLVIAHAEPAPFDLNGPTLEVQISRGAKTLGVAEVPNLAAGDQLSIKADLPTTQSAQYLMVAAFLRGSTNPPPPNWFYRCETWTAKCLQEGLSVTVPPEAQQLLVFLAPRTSGDFRTLVDAVRGRPGAFVRASQDLNQAALDRSRLESYLRAVRSLAANDPARLKDVAPLLARSLAIKVDDKCLEKIPELQAPCLMQGRDQLILTDGHSTSIVEALTSGPASDLAMEASYTPQLSYGYYSPYIASVLDIAHILDSFRTAQYQYIPALASLHEARVVLTLNAAPSFHNPKSVLVAALPAVEQPQLPPLHAVEPKQIYCARKSALVLPVEGAPLVFSTDYVHDVSLRVTGKDGKSLELPARADAEQGGFIIDTSGLGSVSLGDTIHASLHGYWGFEQYAGPGFQLVNARTESWALAPKDEGALIVGREGTLHLTAASVSCVDGIMLKDPAGKELQAEWKAIKPDEVEVKLPLQEAKPGALTLLVNQYGASQPQPVELRAFAEAGRLESFAIHAGDAQGTLRGSRLDEVANLTLKGITFVPGKLSTSSQGGDELPMVAQDAASAAALKVGDSGPAKVTLTDGRTFDLRCMVAVARPSVVLLGKSVQLPASSSENNIHLADQDELPQEARLIFSVRAQTPAAFDREAKIEVASVDQSFATALSLANGSITLEDAHVAVATLDPVKAFGPSAFGPLQFRVMQNGIAGDWQPLATLVRLPQLKDLTCPATGELACKLSGANLFLVQAVSGDAHFEHAVQVPDGFPGYALPVPHPAAGVLYVKLRDDPNVINSAALGVQPLTPTVEDATRAPARQAAVHTDDAPETPPSSPHSM